MGAGGQGPLGTRAQRAGVDADVRARAPALERAHPLHAAACTLSRARHAPGAPRRYTQLLQLVRAELDPELLASRAPAYAAATATTAAAAAAAALPSDPKATGTTRGVPIRLSSPLLLSCRPASLSLGMGGAAYAPSAASAAAAAEVAAGFVERLSAPAARARMFWSTLRQNDLHRDVLRSSCGPLCDAMRSSRAPRKHHASHGGAGRDGAPGAAAEQRLRSLRHMADLALRLSHTQQQAAAAAAPHELGGSAVGASAWSAASSPDPIPGGDDGGSSDSESRDSDSFQKKNAAEGFDPRDGGGGGEEEEGGEEGAGGEGSGEGNALPRHRSGGTLWRKLRNSAHRVAVSGPQPPTLSRVHARGARAPGPPCPARPTTPDSRRRPARSLAPQVQMQMHSFVYDDAVALEALCAERDAFGLTPLHRAHKLYMNTGDKGEAHYRPVLLGRRLEQAPMLCITCIVCMGILSRAWHVHHGMHRCSS